MISKKEPEGSFLVIEGLHAKPEAYSPPCEGANTHPLLLPYSSGVRG